MLWMMGNVMDNGFVNWGMEYGLESNSLDCNCTLTLIGWYDCIKETAIDFAVKYKGTGVDYYCITVCVMYLYTLECMVYVMEYCRCNGGWCL